jgi:hypothetical protein
MNRFMSETAAANNSGAMEADTIKNGRNSKSQKSSKKLIIEGGLL